MSGLTEKQSEEVFKILKYLKNIETVIITSPNPEQKERLQKETVAYKRKIMEMIPDQDITRKNVEQISQLLGFDLTQTTLSKEKDSGASSHQEEGLIKILGIAVNKAHPKSNSSEVNVVAFTLKKIKDVYWDILSDRYCWMDYIHTAQRDALQLKMEGASRNVRDLIIILDDIANADLPVTRERLLQVKERQTRSVIMECDLFLKSMRNFLQRLLEDAGDTKNIVRNPHQKVTSSQNKVNTDISKGETVMEILLEFSRLCEESIQHIAMPEVKFT